MKRQKFSILILVYANSGQPAQDELYTFIGNKKTGSTS